MPENEIGDRVHNFFGQENLSQGQHQPQVVSQNWPGLTNTLWTGSQRQINVPFNPNLKNYNGPSSDLVKGHGGQSSDIPHGLNFVQSTVGPALGKNHSQSQQTVVSSYMHGNQVFQTSNNEMSHLGANSGSDWHNLTSRGFSMLEAQVGNGPYPCKKNLMTIENTESPLNYNFFGGQQQLSGQHSGILQSLSRQPPGAGDMQLMQQQAMLKQMHELQRQQLQQQQRDTVNQFAAIASQPMVNQSTTLINGIPVHDSSNFSWPSEMVATESNWLQRGVSPVMQGSSPGHMISPQPNQALRFMGSVPQQSDHSFYGVPVTNTDNSSQYSHFQTVSDNSFSANQFCAPEQAIKQDRTSAPRQEYQGKSMFGQVAGPITSSGANLQNSQHLGQQEGGRLQEVHGMQELACFSETSQEKQAMSVAPSQNVATLDPEEEKILFGSDDSVWDGADFGFSSIPSGTWSALMQSAVAETSSGDAAPQGEWSGLSFHNSEPQTGNLQVTADNSSGKHQSVWPDGSLRNDTTSALPSFPANAGTSTSYDIISGDQQSGFKTRHNQDERLPANSSQRAMQQYFPEGKWLDGSSLQESLPQGNDISRNISNIRGAESIVKSTSDSRTHQQGLHSYNTNEQPSNRQNGWNFIDSFSHGGLAISRGHGNETNGDIHKTMAEGANSSKMGSYLGPCAVQEYGRPTGGGSQIVREDRNMETASAIANLSNMKANPENNQQLHNIGFWKHVNPSVSSKGSTVPKHFQSGLDAGSHNITLPGNNGSDKGAVERHEADDSTKKENSSDSFYSNASQGTTGFARGQNVWLKAGDVRNLSGSKEKSSGQVAQRPGSRKFQYHPMGDVEVDEDPSHESKQTIGSQSTHQQVSRGFKGPDQGYLAQSTFADDITKSSAEMDKGNVPAFWGEPKGPNEDPSKNMLPAYGPNASCNFDRSVSNLSNRSTTPSKNMLELFHKVDQSSEKGPLRNSSSTNCYPSSEVPGVEDSNGIVDRNQQNQPSVPQTFGLQLGPPSQLSINKDQASFSQGPAQAPNLFSATHMSPGSSLQTANAASPYNIQGNNPAASNCGLPYTISHLQNQGFTNSRGQNPFLASVPNISRVGQNNDLATVTDTSRPNNNNQSQEFPLLEATPVSQPFAIGSMSQKGPFSNSQYNVPSQPHFLGAQVPASSNFQTQPRNDLERTFSGMQKADGQHVQGASRSCDTVASNSQGVGEAQSITTNAQKLVSTDADSAQKPPSASQGKANQLPDVSPSSPAISQREIEAFGRSLRPNNISQNFSLLHQMQAMKKAEFDPGNRGIKRFKGSDSGPNSESASSKGGQQLFNYNATAKDDSINHPSVSSMERAAGFSPKQGDNSTFFVRGNHPQISPQMAPSWFDQYGVLKNGQMLPMHGAKISMPVKPADGSSENSLSSNLPDKTVAAADISQLDTIQQSENQALVARAQFSLPHVLPPQGTDATLDVRSKKRKSVTIEMIPWFKEVLCSSRGLQNISMSEIEWARATNRLTEKVDDVSEVIEDGPPNVRSKRRLIKTTQLLQQVLHPPPASLFSVDASTHYESVAYFTARLALGDACSSVSFKKDSVVSRDSTSLIYEKEKEPERTSEDFCKLTEDFTGRAKKLADDLTRLEKGVSILDLKLECQDLEKFSVINRFAKFHSRGQADGAETSSSSDANATQKPLPQRYVTAVPMPRNLPDRVQCLPL